MGVCTKEWERQLFYMAHPHCPDTCTSKCHNCATQCSGGGGRPVQGMYFQATRLLVRFSLQVVSAAWPYKNRCGCAHHWVLATHSALDLRQFGHYHYTVYADQSSGTLRKDVREWHSNDSLISFYLWEW